MFALSSAALLGWVLLASHMGAATQTPPPVCETGTRHIEVMADASKTPEVCIRPELSTTLFFDAPLARVEVEGRERFRRVEQGPESLTLVASASIPDGARVPVTVSFQDGAAPTTVTFVLVVHPSQAERQVEVSRHERTVASYRQGEQQARAEAEQCREDKARLQAECGGLVGLTGLIANGWLDERDVVARVLTDVTRRPENLLETRKVISYRSIGLKSRGRVAVKVLLFNPRGRPPWTPAGVSLVGARGEELPGLTVWPLKPIPPGEQQEIVVEMDAAESEARGLFTLEVWAGEAGMGRMTLDGVTFP